MCNAGKVTFGNSLNPGLAYNEAIVELAIRKNLRRLIVAEFFIAFSSCGKAKHWQREA
jgi:hypothetical protein